jgi:hypothetical protein
MNQPEKKITRADEVKQERRRRQDSGPLVGLKLAVPEELKEPGYEYHWFNDKDGGGRLYDKTKLDDWDIVQTKAIEGTGEGVPVSRIVGKQDNGQPMKAYLCRKPKEYYRADQQERQARIKEQEDSIKRGVVADPKGLKGESAYVPEGGISIRSGG